MLYFVVLQHVKAYSLRDKDVGYCQGSGFIVGLLLMHVSSQQSLAMCSFVTCEYLLVSDVHLSNF